jgi:uncharacterized protein YhjY with autotransporter beta-barrel domain
MAVTTAIVPAGLRLGGMASGGTGGAEYSTFISGGYDFHCGHLSIGPIAALQYTYVNYDGQLGRNRYDSNAVTGGVRISF